MSEFAKPKMTFGDTLRFTMYAYGKLIYMRDKGPTEVAGYGITGTEDPLLVTDFQTIKQKCTSASFDFDTDDGVEFMERMMDQGIEPWKCQNILIHSHPHGCDKPSPKDEKTFAQAFSHPNWAIMLILAKDNKTYCRLKVNIGPGVVKELKVAIDWSFPFPESNFEAWDEEYKTNVTNRFPATKSQLLDIGFACHWENGEAMYLDYESDCYYGYEPIEQKWFTYDEEGDWKEVPTPKEEWVDEVIEWADGRRKEIAKAELKIRSILDDSNR